MFWMMEFKLKLHFWVFLYLNRCKTGADEKMLFKEELICDEENMFLATEGGRGEEGFRWNESCKMMGDPHAASEDRSQNT